MRSEYAANLALQSTHPILKIAPAPKRTPTRRSWVARLFNI